MDKGMDQKAAEMMDEVQNKEAKMPVIDPEIFKRLMGKLTDIAEGNIYDDNDHYDIEEEAKEVLAILSLDPPPESPFSEISPAPWRGLDCEDRQIYDSNGVSIADVWGEDHFMSNKILFIAAPDLRECLYEARKLLIICKKGVPIGCLYSHLNESVDKSHGVLKAAGVSMEESE